MARNTTGKFTRNPASVLFGRLTKLFSGPIVDRSAPTPTLLKRRHLEKFKFHSATGKEFKRDAYNPFSALQLEYLASQDRLGRYLDYRQMMYSPDINSALDIYADEITTFTPYEPVLKINSSNAEIKEVLDVLFYDILNIEHSLFYWARAMCKYGDFFLYLDIDEEEGIRDVIGLPESEVERLEGLDETNPNYVQFQWNSKGASFENWQICHFRNLGEDKYAPYGTSVLDGARRIWKQLNLIEDAMMAYRIVRAPERRVFYIDVGNIQTSDIEQYMLKVQTQMKRSQVINESTGRIDLRYRGHSVEEDYFIPVRGDTKTKIDSLPGGQYVGDIDDVKYLRDKQFAALKIPQSYLSMEGGGEDRGSLTQKDIVFSRTIQRLQQSVIAELTKMATIHLFALGYRQKDLVSFRLSLSNPSKVAEMQHLEEWRAKFDIAGAATEGYFSRRWVYENIFNMSEEDIIRITRERFYDKKLDAKLESIAAVGEAAMAGGGGGAGGTLSDLFGGDEGEADLAEPSDITGDEETVPAPEDETLLAAPAKRDEEVYVKMSKSKLKPGDQWSGSANSKGKMNTQGTTDHRDGFGPRRKNMNPGAEQARRATRNLYPNLVQSKRLSKGLMEEQKVLSMGNEIRSIIKELEKKDIKKEETKDEDKTQ